MKTAIYIENGLTQIVLTPETDWEKKVVDTIDNGNVSSTMKTGSFYACQGGWTRRDSDKNSLMIILKEPNQT